MATHPRDLVMTRLLDCVAIATVCGREADGVVLCLDTWDGGVGKPLGKATAWDKANLLATVSALRVQLLARCGFLPVVPAPQVGEGDAEGYVAACCFRRAPQAPRWRLSHLGRGQFEAFGELFVTVFGHAMAPALWQWKYGAGRGCAVVAWRGDRLIAHYGGNLRRALAFGELVWALQICDAMVDPRERAVMTKTGAMYQVTAAFLELYQGLGGIPLAFGFPNRRAMRLGERLGFYAEVGTLVELRWPSLARSPRLMTRMAYLDPASSADRRAVQVLWTAMAHDLGHGVIGVRDWDYLRYRYLDHPERHYELVLVRSRWTRVPLGLLVLHLEEDAVALTDLVAPLRHLPALLVQARRLTGLWGRSSLYAWITRQHAFRLTTANTAERDIEVSIPTNTWVPQPFSPAQLANRWWLTIGDTDFL